MKIFVPGILLVLLGCSTADCKYNRTKDKEAVLAPSPTAAPVDPGPKVKVFRSDGSKQCDIAKGMALEEMEKQLGGIMVFSREKTRDGLVRIQMCGADTGWINVFEIKESDFAVAEKAGFKKLGADGKVTNPAPKPTKKAKTPKQ